MPRRSTIPTATLLLDLLQAAAERPLTISELQGLSSRGARRRITAGVAALREEGLLRARPQAGEQRLAPTAAGFEALRRAGRQERDATILFTDIVDSTELIARFGETGAHERRQRHFALCEQVVTARRGRVVKNLGDGLMIEFADAADGVQCAAELQRAVSDDADQIGLRVGLHTGPLLREDDDVFGTTVIVASRLCSGAGAGEIRLSEATRALAGEGLGGASRPLGALRLKGLAQPVAACALWWTGRSSQGGAAGHGPLAGAAA